MKVHDVCWRDMVLMDLQQKLACYSDICSFVRAKQSRHLQMLVMLFFATFVIFFS